MKLSAKSLAKSYKRRPVVRDVSIEISSGEVIGLLGPNGAGKTTCFYMIVGLVNADHGEVTLDGKNLTAMAMHERARSGVGYLPQEPSIFRKLSVEDNILGILEMRKDLDRSQQRSKMESLLEEFNIQHIRKNMGMSLSGGERRRVEIARALATEPKFILLDEPFAGVDPISVNDIKQTILHLQSKGIGILITDHNVRETLDICEKAYIVNDGFILASGTPTEILNNEQVKKAYLGDKFSL
ncbi:LPS export ABC transporter ATP-binding protein ['Osedax' symbiont bacterium Rs2_46_30_T18]|nr:LPS export ABC transporter ATP-binding protein ['Osedax' symbiont bacterium Rs2_46_30_T18]